jgi:hypothetical protein
VLKKTSASIGLVVATAAGILLSGAPAQAQSSSISSCCFGHHSRHHGSNWNGNRTRPRIFVRIYIYNKNNNAAVARNGARQRQRTDQLQRRIPRRERRGPGVLGQDLRGRGVLAPAPMIGPERTRSAPVNQPVAVTPRVSQSAPRSERDEPARGVTPRDNGQVSKNGVVRSGQDASAKPNLANQPNEPSKAGQPGTEEAGQNGLQANPGTNEPNQDINPLLDQALS